MSTAWLLDGAVRSVLAIGLALLMDALLGDPVFNWHPVRLMGRLAAAMEGFCRRLSGLPVPADATRGLGCASPVGARAELRAVAAGALAWALTFGLSAGLALVVSRLAALFHPAFGLALDAAIIWASVAPRDLASHALRVKRALERDRRELVDVSREGPVHGRAAVAMIVGREISVLDETGVAKACIESVAESSIDGAAAPLFWSTLLGPWAALAYRCVNTMDSMFGHRNARYFSFGLVAARADDLANWLPARLSSILACLAAPLAGGSIRGSLASFFRYRRSHASPNAGHPEAAYAGAFGLRLGGPVSYPEGLAEKPWMNPDGRAAGIMDIHRAVKLMYIQTLVSAIVFLACRFALGLLFNGIQSAIQSRTVSSSLAFSLKT
ncbi:MAG: CobD/CbiB family cobalamin biosynthesis protein [Spirochaetota bacterium]